MSSFRVIDAPARFIRDRIDPATTTSTTTTTTTTGAVSDVSTPGAPVIASTQPPRRVVTQPRATVAPRATTKSAADRTVAGTQRKPSEATTPRTPATPSAQFPTAKPVPGKPGYVYSVDPKGGIVDVTGYKPGDKAKDPYTQQVFIVP